MKDLLRDRRTIMAMMVLPVTLIPIILTVVTHFTFPDPEAARLKEIRLAVFSNNGNGADLVEQFRLRKDVKLFENISPYEFKQLILDDSLDFGLIIEENFDQQIKAGQAGGLKLFLDYSFGDTLLYSRFASTVRSYRKSVIEERLEALGSNTDILNPFDTDITDVKPSENMIGSFAGSVLPLFFIMFSFMGAMYPAIDLFTGEKERGTIETLLVLPASKLQILSGKMLVIITTGVISGLLTFLGIYLYIYFHRDLPIISNILDFQSTLIILPMTIPLTTFFAGLLIPASIYAKSFKEAQSLLQPLIILIMIPVVIAMIPGIKLSTQTALIPIFNIALASKEVVAGSINYTLLIPVYISLFIIAAIGILLAKHWFNNESNIFRT